MCNREAPDVEQFAQQHADKIKVVGIGTQDGFDEAKKFYARHDITFEFLWDESFDTWNAFGVQSQPAAVLLSADGRQLGKWSGMFSIDEVLELAAK